jgi:hypothetical protein
VNRRLTVLLTLVLTIGLNAFAQNASQSAKAIVAREKRYQEYGKRLGDAFDDTWRAAAKIDTRKGIGEYEALALSSAYFFAYISLCGGVNTVTDKGDKWIADTAAGYAGSNGPKIIVEKKTGFTYARGHEKVANPKVYLKFLMKKSKQALQPIAWRSWFLCHSERSRGISRYFCGRKHREMSRLRST